MAVDTSVSGLGKRYISLYVVMCKGRERVREKQSMEELGRNGGTNINREESIEEE